MKRHRMLEYITYEMSWVASYHQEFLEVSRDSMEGYTITAWRTEIHDIQYLNYGMIPSVYISIYHCQMQNQSQHFFLSLAEIPKPGEPQCHPKCDFVPSVVNQCHLRTM